MDTQRVLLLDLTLALLPAQASLIDRGNGLIYDDVLDITWLQDASLGTMQLGGFVNWDGAVAWADSLVFQGYTDWRLPSISVAGGLPTGSTASPVDCRTASEAACRDNELGYMFYYNLGGAFGTALIGDEGLIHNIPIGYWSGSEYAPHPADAWIFSFAGGGQALVVKGLNSSLTTWAVRPGDVLTASVPTAVPEPPTLLLFTSGLAGLA